MDAYEHSELLLYLVDLMVENGRLQDAIDYLQKNEARFVDVISYREIKGAAARSSRTVHAASARRRAATEGRGTSHSAHSARAPPRGRGGGRISGATGG